MWGILGCASQFVQHWGYTPKTVIFDEEDDDKSLAFLGTPRNWLVTLVRETANQGCPVYHWRLVWNLLEFRGIVRVKPALFGSFWQSNSGWFGNPANRSGFGWIWTGQGCLKLLKQKLRHTASLSWDMLGPWIVGSCGGIICKSASIWSLKLMLESPLSESYQLPDL